MVKDHSESEKGNPLPPHRLLFPINSKGSFICTIPQTGLHIPRPLLHQSWSTGSTRKKGNVLFNDALGTLYFLPQTESLAMPEAVPVSGRVRKSIVYGHVNTFQGASILFKEEEFITLGLQALEHSQNTNMSGPLRHITVTKMC